MPGDCPEPLRPQPIEGYPIPRLQACSRLDSGWASVLQKRIFESS